MGKRSSDERRKIDGRLAQGKALTAVYTPPGTHFVHEIGLRREPTRQGYIIAVSVYREGEFYAEDNWLVDDSWRFDTVDEALSFLETRFGLDYREIRLRAG